MSVAEASGPLRFRERFPIFERKIFLNSCSQGALSREVDEAYRAYLDSWRDEGSPWETWVELLESTRAETAAFLGCSPDELAVTSCASVAAGAVGSALSFDGGRDAILLGDFEFPTMVHNWMAQAKRGARLVRVRAEGDRLPAESFLRALDERVRLAPVAHVSFRNGYRQDLEAVVRGAREVGALSFVDDYQSTGTRPIDVRALGCDFLVTGSLKYLLGPSGLAFLYVRRELVERLEPTLTGWFGQERPFDFDIERATYHESARRFETGTPPIGNLYGARAGLALLRSVKPEAVAAHVERLASRLVAEARARGVRVLTPEEPERRGPLVVLGTKDGARLVDALKQEDVVVSARGSGLRVSFHYYNVEGDVDRLLEILDRHEDLLETGQSGG